MSLCLIFNPNAGRGIARRRLQQVQKLLADRADFKPTTEAGHAEELAYAAALQGYPAVVAAGGDGTVHEVANGLLRAGKEGVAFGVIPLGSGNDYAHSLRLPSDYEVLCQRLLSGSIRRVDVGKVLDDKGRTRYFVNTLGLGLSGTVALEARKIRWARGLMLYGLAALRAICWHFDAPDTVLTIDDQRLETPTLYLAVALGEREGRFVVAPGAELDDGLFDYLHAGRMTRWRALTYLPGLATGRIPDYDPLIRRGRCRSIRIQSQAPLAVHLDGEIFACPTDQVSSLQIELIPSGLMVVGSGCHSPAIKGTVN